MNNYKQILLLGILTISINCFGNSYFQIERIEKGSYAIPLVSNKEHPDIAEKINQFIQMTTVYDSYKVVGDKIFDGMINEDGYTGTTSLAYTILLNSEAILSIQFNDETLTAYPDTHTYYLNFNAASGDIIDLSELLNLSGVHHLNDLASIVFNNSIHAYQNDVMKDHSLDTSNRNEQLEAVFQMTECNSTHNNTSSSG